MSKSAIVFSLVLIIFMVFRSEAQTTDGAVQNQSHKLRFLQFLQTIGNKIIDNVLSIKDEHPLGSFSDIESLKQQSSPSHAEKISGIRKKIAYWAAAKPIDSKCDHHFQTAYGFAGDMSTSLDTCLQEVGNATFTRYAETMSIFYQSTTKINIFKKNLDTCVNKCAGIISCTHSLFCLTGRWIEVLWHTPSVYGEKMAYRTNARKLQQLLNAFEDNVQFCLDNRFQYKSSIDKIDAALTEGGKCKNGS